MNSDNIMVVTAFAIYLVIMMSIGLYYYRKTKDMDGYILLFLS